MPDIQYMSQKTFDELTAELERRKMEVRRASAAQLEYAKQLGDLSENFEYHDAKEKQAENEQRIQILDTSLKNASLISASDADAQTVQVGMAFTVTRDGKEQDFMLVGSHEANPLEGKISNESPLGTVFLGTRVGETVTVQTPGGEVRYTILRFRTPRA